MVRRWSKRVNKLTLDWNYYTQSVARIFGDSMTIATTKIFSDYWHLSAKMITPVCLITTLLPAQPWISDRNDGVIGEYSDLLPHYNFTSTLPFSLEFQKMYKSLPSLSTFEERLKVSNQLWEVKLFLKQKHFDFFKIKKRQF